MRTKNHPDIKSAELVITAKSNAPHSISESLDPGTINLLNNGAKKNTPNAMSKYKNIVGKSNVRGLGICSTISGEKEDL